MNLVIIGGDAAGMSAASRAKRTMPDLSVTVLEQSGDVSYSACGMPYNIADADRDMDDLVVRHADVFRDKQGIDLRTGHRVERLDIAAKTVSGTDKDGSGFAVAYDRLLIATGASAWMPGEIDPALPGVFTLKNLGQGRRIKGFLAERDVGHAVIVGMGYIAMEMAEALSARGIRVSMIKPGPVVLPWMAPELRDIVTATLERRSVALHPGVPVERIDRDGDRLRVIYSGGDLPADMVLVAAGVVPNSQPFIDAGLNAGPAGSIAVDHMLRTSHPDIYAAGDCADAFHVVTGRRVWIPLALRANRAGWAAADNICGASATLDGVAGTAVFRVFDLEVARTGLSPDEAEHAGFDPVSVSIKTRSRAHAHPGATDIHAHLVADRVSGRLLGAQLVGTEGAAHRINAAAVALHARMTLPDFSQSDLAYAPPFGPVWDPLLVAANQLLKKLP